METKYPAFNIRIGDMVTNIEVGRDGTNLAFKEPAEVIQHRRLDDGRVRITLATPGMDTVICPAGSHVTIKLTH